MADTSGVPTTPCREWEGGRTAAGYGTYRIASKSVYAHRQAWEQAHGPIPDGMVVMHRCDNPPCYRVDHLQLGTHRANHDDAVTKGRKRAAPPRSPRKPNEAACVNGHGPEFIRRRPPSARHPQGLRYCVLCQREQHREAQRRYVAKRRTEGTQRATGGTRTDAIPRVLTLRVASADEVDKLIELGVAAGHRVVLTDLPVDGLLLGRRPDDPEAA